MALFGRHFQSGDSAIVSSLASLDEGLRTAGAHAVRWSGIDAAGRPLASGVYFYRLRLPTAVPAAALATHKMLLLR